MQAGRPVCAVGLAGDISDLFTRMSESHFPLRNNTRYFSSALEISCSVNTWSQQKDARRCTVECVILGQQLDEAAVLGSSPAGPIL